MTKTQREPGRRQGADASRLAEAVHLQAIEGNPLSPDELAMFEMFEHEEWTPEDRRAYIEQQLRVRRCAAAAE